MRRNIAPAPVADNANPARAKLAGSGFATIDNAKLPCKTKSVVGEKLAKSRVNVKVCVEPELNEAALVNVKSLASGDNTVDPPKEETGAGSGDGGVKLFSPFADAPWGFDVSTTGPSENATFFNESGLTPLFNKLTVTRYFVFPNKKGLFSFSEKLIVQLNGVLIAYPGSNTAFNETEFTLAPAVVPLFGVTSLSDALPSKSNEP